MNTSGIRHYIDNVSTLGKFRLVSRLGALVAATALLAVIAAYSHMWIEQERDRNVASREVEFAARIVGARLHLNQALGARLAFPKAREASMERFSQSIAAADAELELANAAAANAKARSAVATVRQDLAALREAFDKATRAHIEMGLVENDGLRGKLLGAAHAFESGLVEWNADALSSLTSQVRRREGEFLQRPTQEHLQGHADARERLQKSLVESPLAARAKEELKLKLAAYAETFDVLAQLALAAAAFDEEFQVQLSDKTIDDAQQLQTVAAEAGLEVERAAAQSSRQSWLVFVAAAAMALMLAVAAFAWATKLVSKSIVGSVSRLADAMRRVSHGDYEARTRLTANDEIGVVGRALDALVAERVATLADSQREYELLNSSIVRVLEAVAELGRRDLSVRVPVSEDITGPVADAINALSSETAKVLQGVTRISGQVARASNDVQAKSEAVMQVAAKERQQVDEAVKRVTIAAEEMNKIAELARQSQTAADAAIKTTQNALKTVTATVTGISSTRETIRETEKRIKRLGERSQEISGVVSLINGIAERTHILALNASMHAAAAGEAGRGSAVVADEVQRLAENAREATTRIAALVSTIQADTQDTVTTMNDAITQVVEGSRLAEEAGRQMQATQDTTTELVMAVQQISTNSLKQAQLTNELQDYAQQIRESTAQTSRQLTEQGEQTKNLVEYAGKLVESVGVFKLPALAA